MKQRIHRFTCGLEVPMTAKFLCAKTENGVVWLYFLIPQQND